MSETARRTGGVPVIERWSLPPVQGPIVGLRETERARETEERERAEREAARRRGYEEGYAEGRAEGLAAGQAEIRSRIAELDARISRLDSILQLLARPLEDLDAQVERQLAALALTVGKQLARRELRADPAQVIAVIRECVSRLPASCREVRVHLHPEDAAVVRERLAAPSQERVWSIVDDPTLSRGGCLIRSESSQIDARFESRLAAVVNSVLGEERSPQRRAADDASESEA
jgi:Flagellar biosynthesis/type III secretory pathway protein|nr:MAG: flagellar assembly protein FliH [Pseudomonadota bacterium]